MWCHSMVSLINASRSRSKHFFQTQRKMPTVDPPNKIDLRPLVCCRFKDGREITKKSTRYTTEYNPVAHVASLYIHHPEPTDSARYRLEASNKFGQVDTTGRVTVNGECVCVCGGCTCVCVCVCVWWWFCLENAASQSSRRVFWDSAFP